MTAVTVVTNVVWLGGSDRAATERAVDPPSWVASLREAVEAILDAENHGPPDGDASGEIVLAGGALEALPTHGAEGVWVDRDGDLYRYLRREWQFADRAVRRWDSLADPLLLHQHGPYLHAQLVKGGHDGE
ncbi:hypothetical protein SEA_BOILGATE_69 [Mycobacterium phage Boilgate]|nr:hypothetical protein SEA_BOILGATE_69 [Mycobacterium phage Boilgate]